MSKNKRREKCTFVNEVRDPIQTSLMRWTKTEDAPPSYTLGVENNPHARKTRIDGEGRDERRRFERIGTDSPCDRELKSGYEGRKNTPYTGSVRFHNK